MFLAFPREIGLNRKLIFNENQFYRYVNLYNGKLDVYTSLYAFSDYDYNTKKANYQTAVVNKLYFDFDGKNGLEQTRIFRDYLLKRNIAFTPIFSGGGFHFYVYARTSKREFPKEQLEAAQCFFIDKLGLEVDPTVISDLAQITRVPNTYNCKEGRRRYCIPMTPEQLDLALDDIYQLARRQQFLPQVVFGHKVLNLDSVNYKPVHRSFAFRNRGAPRNVVRKLKIDFNNFTTLDIDPNRLKFPECVQTAIDKKIKGMWDRYIIILYLRSRLIKLNRTIEFLKDILTPEKFQHCLIEEKQPYYIYNRFDLNFPNRSWLRKRGYCNDRCDDCPIERMYGRDEFDG